MYKPFNGTGFRLALAIASLLLLPLASLAEPLPGAAWPPAVGEGAVTAPVNAATGLLPVIAVASVTSVASPDAAGGDFFRRLSKGFSLHKENYVLLTIYNRRQLFSVHFPAIDPECSSYGVA
jgi:hypothetical protein